MKIMKLFYAVITLLAVCTVCCAQSRASFGESCNTTTRCDSKASLTCVNDTCRCLKETEMKYDLKRNKCVVLSSERCSYTAIEILSDQTQGKRYSERLDCVENAFCKNDGYCGCNDKSYETVDNLCSPKKGHQENCTKNSECRDEINLICVDGKCSCNTTEAVYDSTLSECVGKVGAHCRQYRRCIKNTDRRCGYGGVLELCQCSRGYTKSADGLCLGSYGSSCDAQTSPCNDDWSCIDGRCTCPYPTRQVYENRDRECLSLVNGPCSEVVGNKTLVFKCNGDAECRNDKGVYECLCKTGFIKSKDGICKKAFGTQCNKDDECDQVPQAKLICKQGTCSCGDFQEYDKNSSMCVGLYGAKCDDIMKCTKNIICEKDRDMPKEGICKCGVGALVNSSRMCNNNTEVATVTDRNDIE